MRVFKPVYTLTDGPRSKRYRTPPGLAEGINAGSVLVVNDHRVAGRGGPRDEQGKPLKARATTKRVTMPDGWSITVADLEAASITHKGESRRWHAEFTDELNGNTRRIKGLADKEATATLAATLQRISSKRRAQDPLGGELRAWIESCDQETRSQMLKWGLIDERDEALAKPLIGAVDESGEVVSSGHLEDWQRSLSAGNRSPKHVRGRYEQAKKIIEHCGFAFYSDISASRVTEQLARLRDGKAGVSIKTANDYLGALKQFCKWMVIDRRAGESPVGHLRKLNAAVDVRRRRRALSIDEVRRLVSAAERGPERFGMSGVERGLLYRFMLQTGLRSGEVRSLTRADIHLDCDEPFVVVQAAYSKHRKEDEVSLRGDLASRLRSHLAAKAPAAEAFALPAERVMVPMLREDLEVAEIEYELPGKRFADFHALRHTFCTHLAAAGVAPRVAQSLARHETPGMTMKVYTHTLAGAEREGVESLPSLDVAPASVEQRATGTDGAAPQHVDEKALALFRDAPRPRESALVRQNGDIMQETQGPVAELADAADLKSAGGQPP